MEIVGSFVLEICKRAFYLAKKMNPCFKIFEIIHRLPEYTDADHKQKKVKTLKDYKFE